MVRYGNIDESNHVPNENYIRGMHLSVQMINTDWVKFNAEIFIELLVRTCYNFYVLRASKYEFSKVAISLV